MKIATKIISLFILLGLVITLCAVYYYYITSNQLIQNQVIDTLEAHTQITKNFINVYLEEQKEKLEIAAGQSSLTNEELKQFTILNDDFNEFFVLDQNGIIIASSNESMIGQDKSSDAYFINAKNKTYIKPAYLSKTTGKDVIAVATPFHDGVLVARINLASLNEITSDKSGLGESGESLLGYKNPDGKIVFVTERRFKEEAKNGTIPMQIATEKNETTILDSRDYRGFRVIAVTRYIEEINVGLVTKMDISEALETPRNILIRSAINTGIFAIVILIFGGTLISLLITRPLLKLKQGAEEIGNGKLDIKIKINSKDEIEELANTINLMGKNLKKTQNSIIKNNKELEHNISDRTKDLQSKVEQLEKFNKILINREGKMIELKNKLKDFKGENKK